MVFRAGGELQGGAEALRVMDPELGAQVIAELDTGLGGPAAENPLDIRMGGEGLHHGG